MRSAFVAVVAALWSVAAQAQPAADDAFAQGRALRLAGQAEAAIPKLEAASKAAPRDADVWLNLGLAYDATQRFAEADRALAEAQRLAPDYTDVTIARARTAYFQQQFDEADRRLAPVLAQHPDNAEARALSRQIAAARREAPPAWRLDLSISHANLGKGLPDATRQSAALTHDLGERRWVSGSVEHVRQFGVDDVYLEGQYGTPRYFVALGGTPDADFRPKWQLRAGVYTDSWALGGGWTGQLSVDGAWARYPVGEVRSLQPAFTLAKGDDVVLVARWINTLDEQDEYRSGYAVRGAWRAAPRVQLSAGWADAPETSEGVTVNVRAVSLGVAYDLNAATTLRLDAVREMRTAYDRDELSLGLTRRF